MILNICKVETCQTQILFFSFIPLPCRGFSKPKLSFGTQKRYPLYRTVRSKLSALKRCCYYSLTVIQSVLKKVSAIETRPCIRCPLCRGSNVFLPVQVNESRYIALSVVSWSIKKFFPIDCVNICLFVIFFWIDFARWKSVRLHRIAYIVIHEL